MFSSGAAFAIPARGPLALGLECGALGRQYPLTPSNMGLEYLNPDRPVRIGTLVFHFRPVVSFFAKIIKTCHRVEWYEVNYLTFDSLLPPRIRC